MVNKETQESGLSQKDYKEEKRLEENREVKTTEDTLELERVRTEQIEPA